MNNNNANLYALLKVYGDGKIDVLTVGLFKDIISEMNELLVKISKRNYGVSYKLTYRRVEKVLI